MSEPIEVSPSKDNETQFVANDKIQSSLDSSEIKSSEKVKQNYIKPHTTLLEKPLSEIIDNTIHFMGSSIDDYYSSIDKAEIMLNQYGGQESRAWVHIYAMVLFATDNDNTVYMGFALIFFSIIIYFLNITSA
jgi:hypothetical protein